MYRDRRDRTLLEIRKDKLERLKSLLGAKTAASAVNTAIELVLSSELDALKAAANDAKLGLVLGEETRLQLVKYTGSNTWQGAAADIIYSHLRKEQQRERLNQQLRGLEENE